MSFWGVEVKPGTPFTHNFDRTVGRLRVSQATLGIGSRTARSLVQCNVGSKSPVFLCALLPNKIESCHLDLEFEEADDVVFSVLGPRSVHLSGYYVGSSSANRNSDTESYGEDIANTDTEVSDQGSEDDAYGGSFIDDDDDGEEVVEEEEEEEEGEPKVFPSSPICRNGDAGRRKGNHKGLKEKKRQVFEPVDDINSQRSEDEMNCTVAILKNKKPASKCNVIESEDDNNEQESKGDKSCLLTAFENEIPECTETADKVTVDVAALSQSGGRNEDCRDKDDVPVEVTNMSNSSKDCPARNVDPHVDARSIKTSDPIESEPDHAKDPVAGITSLENVYADGNTEQVTGHDMSQVLKGTKDAQSSVSNMNVGNHSVSLDRLAELQVENPQKLKRKKDFEGDGLGECNGSGPGDAGEELNQVVENDDHCASLDLSACERAENGPNLKKQKKWSEEREWDDCQDSGHVDGVVDIKQDVQATDRGNELLPTTEAIQVLTTIQSIGIKSINSDNGSQPDKKNKKKKKKTNVEDDGTGSMLAKDGDYSIPDVTAGEAKQMVEATDMDKDLPATTDKNKDPTTQSNDVISNVDNGIQPEKKLNKKKKKKTEVEDDGTGSMLAKDGDYSIPDLSAGDAKQMVEATDMDKDLPATTDKNKDPTTQSDDVISNVANGSQPEKKLNKKKKKKTKVEDDGTGCMLAKDVDYSIPDVTVGEAKQMVEATDIDQDLPATADKNKDPTTQSNDVISNVADGSQPEKKLNKKKKTKTKVVDDGGSSLLDLDKSVGQSKNISNDNVAEQIKQIVEAIEMDMCLLPTIKQHEIPTTCIDDVSPDVADGFQFVKKDHKSKKPKVGDDGMNSMHEADMKTNGILHPSLNDEGTIPESTQVRSFSNGLIIEDLARGKPNGKAATAGRKVKVHYTGMLRENRHTFTPSAGVTLKFCLGNENVLPGWNIGIEGMRVGDKRRLTIPPLLGYGSEGYGEQIPPNSWLVYDIELVSVRR